jgi:hypothetical protein
MEAPHPSCASRLPAASVGRRVPGRIQQGQEPLREAQRLIAWHEVTSAPIFNRGNGRDGEPDHVDGVRPGRALSELADMIPALQAAGAIQPGSPALGRLTALARRLGIDLPAGLPAAAPHADLPDAWNSVLADRGRRDGRDGLAPAAAMLPEADGALCAITGLYSTERAVILRALAWGWHAGRTPFPRTDERYSWWAIDNSGRWHIAQQTNAPIGGINGHGFTDIALIPPLHPAATSLDIILTGPTAQASATTPLDWQPLR